MSLILQNDLSRAGGGYAILHVEGGPVPTALAVEDRSSCLYLAPDGKWTRQPNYFVVEKINETSVRLGPDLVDHIAADTILALHTLGGGVLGSLVWPSIRPSAGVSDGEVMPDLGEMAIVGAIGDGPLATASSPSTDPALAATDFTPLPDPPHPSVHVDFRPPRETPAVNGRRSFFKPLIIINGLILLIVGLFAFRGTQSARELVCEPTGALYGSGIAQSLVPCAEKASVDPEEAAYNGYLQCLPGKLTCEQKDCGDLYISKFANGAHAEKVRAASAISQKACEKDADKKNASDIFAAFNECMRTTDNVCNRSRCVDRFRYKLTAEPYASSLRQSAETAANDCRHSKEEAAYAAFSQCIATAVACDTARCASTFTSSFPNSSYIPRVLQAAENAARTCAAERPVAQQPTAPTLGVNPQSVPLPQGAPLNFDRAQKDQEFEKYWQQSIAWSKAQHSGTVASEKRCKAGNCATIVAYFDRQQRYVEAWKYNDVNGVGGARLVCREIFNSNRLMCTDWYDEREFVINYHHQIGADRVTSEDIFDEIFR